MSYLTRPRGYLLLAVIIMATALAGCMTPSVVPAPAPSVPQAETEGEVVMMFVGPTQADCVGVGPMKCLLVKEGSAEGPYLMFYNDIKGFDFEEGYHYELRVRKTNVENAPADGSSIAFELVELVDKTPAGEVSMLYVAPMMVECETTEIYKCLLVADSPDGEYRPFYGKISGFDFEEGYQYALLVEAVAMDQPPSDAPAGVWNLLAVTRKTPAVVSAVSTAPQQTTLEGTLWMLTSYVNLDGQKQPALAGSEVTATFQDGRVVGNAGCNNYTASYTLDGDALVIGPAATTMMACISEELTAQETAYLNALAQVALYKVTDGTLTLLDGAGAPVLECVATIPASLTGTTWEVNSYNNGKEAVVGVSADTPLTMTFGADGQVSGSAGCNNFTGGYTVDGDAITIGPLASTMMMCADPENVMEQEQMFLSALSAATTYTIHGDRLELRTATGALAVSATAQSAEAAAPEAASSAPLEGTLWTLTSYVNAQSEAVTPLADNKVTATFMDGRVSGNASCNNYNADFTVDGNAMQIGAAMTTMMACQPDTVGEQERAYLDALATVASYQIEGQTLSLMNAAGETVLVYAATQPTSLTGTTWLVTSYNNGKEAVVSVNLDTELTMSFSEEGQVAGSSGCNNFTGGYIVDGDAIKVGPLASTMMMCGAPKGVMEQEAQFLAALQAATVLTIQDDKMELRDDTGALQVSAVAQPAETTSGLSLEGAPWVLTSYLNAQGETVAPIEGAEPTATFADGRVSGNASCNSYGADFTVDGASLKFGLAISTMMMCQPEAVAAQEQAYMAALERVASFEIVGEALTLSDAEGNVVLSFEALKPMPLTGTDWQVGFYNNGKEALVSPIAGSAITLLFGDDGSVSGSASCNTFSGGYTLEGDQLTVGQLATTMMMCVEPEGVMEQEAAFMAALQTTATYKITGDALELLNANGGRAVTASAQALALAAGGNPKDVMGKTWVWQKMVTSDRGDIVPTEPAAFTLELLPDGTALVRSDCNSVAGGFTMAEDGSLTLKLPTEGLSNCGVESLSTPFMTGLSKATVFSLGDDALFLQLDADAGSIEFAKAGAMQAAVTAEVVAEPVADNTLVGPAWVWQSFDMSDGSITPVPNLDQYTAQYIIEFMADGTLNVVADCNMAGGAYSEDNGALTIEVAAITRKACPPGSLSDAFISRLNEVATYVMDDGKLYLNLKMDSGNLVFTPLLAAVDRAPELTPTPAPALSAQADGALIIGPTWQWAEFQSNTERFAVAQPERYTVTFRADGKYEVQADCNRGSGSYTLDGKKLTVGPAALTRMACPSDSQADAFLKNLDAARWQFVVGKNLYITTTNGGVMKLMRAK